MRRKDREVTDMGEIEQIIDKCDVCRIAFSDNTIPYIVPMNFGYQLSGEGLILYFHCAIEGKKLDIMNKNANVCFEMDCSHKLVTGNLACDYTMGYESVIGNGQICYITDHKEKIDAFKFIMKKYGKNNQHEINKRENNDVEINKSKNNEHEIKEFKYDENHLKNVTCLKLMAMEFSGKRLK